MTTILGTRAVCGHQYVVKACALINAPAPLTVIPAKAGIHFASGAEVKMDSGLRRNDGVELSPGMTAWGIATD